MNTIRRRWSRWQWVADAPVEQHVSDEAVDGTWDRSQWVGEAADRSRAIADVPDARSDAGFSGGGQNPGGNGWARGYPTRPIHPRP
jgi:hypothetical protein